VPTVRTCTRSDCKSWGDEQKKISKRQGNIQLWKMKDDASWLILAVPRLSLPRTECYRPQSLLRLGSASTDVTFMRRSHGTHHLANASITNYSFILYPLGGVDPLAISSAQSRLWESSYKPCLVKRQDIWWHYTSFIAVQGTESYKVFEMPRIASCVYWTLWTCKNISLEDLEVDGKIISKYILNK
jgi:hypothetical protein